MSTRRFYGYRRTSARLAHALAGLGLVMALNVVGEALPNAVLAAAAHPAAAMVTSVIPSQISPTEFRLVLTFNQPAPQFSVITNDASTDIVAITGAALPPNVTALPGKHGIVQTIGFAQNNGILTVTLAGPAPIHAVATALGERALAITVTSGPGASTSAGTRAGGPDAEAEAAGPDDVFEVVPLKYADVSEIVGLLTAAQDTKPNDNFNPQEPAFGSAGVNNGGGAIATPPFNLGSTNGVATDSIGTSVDGTVGIDRRLNAIVLKGSAARVAMLKARIAKLDVPVTSVILETVFVELTESGAHNVGFDFTNSNGQVATFVYQYNKGGISSSGTAVTDTTQPWGGASLSLQAALSAQVQAGEGRIISKPRIAAQSGSTAKIITGDALPILTSIALSGVNAVQQQVQYVNVGVTLQIAPRVSDDGFVTSHVFAEVSSVTGVSQGYPTISQREASTMATVKDGESFIIGGLTQDSSLSTRNKVPVLGDVPGLGALFNNQNATKSKTNLYIIVTPHIIRGNDARAAALAKED